MINDSDSRVLMSDSLRGQVPDLEEETTAAGLEDAFIIAGLELYCNGKPHVVVGSVVGLSYDSTCLKIDISVPIVEAYTVLGLCIAGDVVCRNYYINHVGSEIPVPGPFRVVSPKVVDFDRQNKMCTLGVDLIKE